MSAHAKVFINIQHTGITSLNNWMPDAIKAAHEWMYSLGFNVNEVGEGQPNAGECKAKEYYWVEMESTSCSYEVFDETYVQSVLDQWIAKFPELSYEYSAYNLDVEPDVFIQAGGVS